METDWAENRAKIPQDFIRGMLGKLLDQRLLDRRARQVPHAPGAHGRTARAPRSTSAIAAWRRSTRPRDPASGNDGQTEWQPRPADPGLEAEFLRRLMVRLGVAGRARASSLRRGRAAPQPRRDREVERRRASCCR